ncbi:MAG: hypothetical protein HC779_02850 [Phyllobacteriaceae bacterium]|nr:hypothetical protein [Phyllobacteriaceae bacterium]
MADARLVADVAVTVDSYHVAASLVAAGIGTAVVDQFSARATATPAIRMVPLTALAPVAVSATKARPCLKSDIADAFIAICARLFGL